MNSDSKNPAAPATGSVASHATLTATAYHEAGHAVMAFVLARPVEKVTIIPSQMHSGGSRLGACKIQKGRFKASQDPLEDEVLILLAGMVAERHITQKYCTAGATQDLLNVQRLLSRRATSEKQLQRLAQRLLDKTEHVLSNVVYARAIQLIAAELIQKETISGRAVRHFVEQAEAGCS